jgi:hypothetical protein
MTKQIKEKILKSIINNIEVLPLMRIHKNLLILSIKEGFTKYADAHAMEFLKDLTDEERLEIFNKFCKSCGSKNNKCQCWNDD